MSESLKYAGELDSGIKYQVHSMTSFSGMEELALIVEGKPVTIITVTRKKNGGIEIKPVLNNKVRIAGQGDPLVTPPEPEIKKPELVE
jgi:hypothetical protein